MTADESEMAFVGLIRTGDRLMKAADDFLRPYGLSDAQYNVLRILEGAEEPLPQQEIAKRLLVSRANVTGLIDRLEAAGYVERRSCDDRRVNMIHLTRKGLNIVEETFEGLVDLCTDRMKSLSGAERKELIRFLSKLLGDEA